MMPEFNLPGACPASAGNKILRAVLTAAVMIFLSASALQAAGEIRIEQVQVHRRSEDKHAVSARMTNTTEVTREVTFRSLLYFYDRTAPAGDIPVMSLRKDRTLILKPGETRDIETLLIREGGPDRGAFRLEPKVRLRRQRPWNY